VAFQDSICAAQLQFALACFACELMPVHEMEGVLHLHLQPSMADVPISKGEAFSLHSRPSAKRKIVLDFDGHTTTGTAWNTAMMKPTIVSKAYDKVSQAAQPQHSVLATAGKRMCWGSVQQPALLYTSAHPVQCRACETHCLTSTEAASCEHLMMSIDACAPCTLGGPGCATAASSAGSCGHGDHRGQHGDGPWILTSCRPACCLITLHLLHVPAGWKPHKLEHC
jgi:hypothetical protein